MSRYHFLRVFRRIIGMTPHQYVLRMRMHRADVERLYALVRVGTPVDIEV